MQNMNLGQAKRESECSYRRCELVFFVVGNDKGMEKDRRLTGLIKLVLKVLQEVESWCYTVGSCIQRRQVQNRDSDVTETDSEGKDTNPVDKNVDVPG
jgi:hypothetical protein